MNSEDDGSINHESDNCEEVKRSAGNANVPTERAITDETDKDEKSAMALSNAAIRKEDLIIGKVVGEGSFSYVARARLCNSNDTYVAVKVMNKHQIMRENKVKYVKNERDVLSQLSHPGIVKMLFTFQDATSLFVGMELAEGGELFQQLQERGIFQQDLACFYAAQIIDVLEYLHIEIGVIHRDLKPENILLTKSGHIKLADFGSSKLVKTGKEENRDKTTENDSGESDIRQKEENSRGEETANAEQPAKRRAMSFVGTVGTIECSLPNEILCTDN